MRFHFDTKDLGLGLLLGIIGLIVTTLSFVKFVNNMNPLNGLLFYYLIFFSMLFLLSRMDLVILGVKINNPQKMLGLLLITMAFFIVTDWSSPYYNLALNKPINASIINPVYFQTSDGAVWYVWSSLIPPVSKTKMFIVRILTYFLTPLTLALLGGSLLKNKAKINPL